MDDSNGSGDSSLSLCFRHEIWLLKTVQFICELLNVRPLSIVREVKLRRHLASGHREK
jgi:hypothetical protein